MFEKKIDPLAEEIETLKTLDYSDVIVRMDGNPIGKNLLSMYQFSEDDIHDYIEDSYKAESLIADSGFKGSELLPSIMMKAVMRQPSTRTGGTMTSAIAKLSGSGELISGMHSSSEAKGESLADSWVAFATQSDVLGIRTAEEFGPMYAAKVIKESFDYGALSKITPVINLGDGKNEHPTQTLGDLFTVHKEFNRFEGLTLAVVGDHERYRAHHSLLIGAAALGMTVIAVESPVSKVPQPIADKLGDKLNTTNDLDAAMKWANVLYIGRNPDEYSGKVRSEKIRSKQLAQQYKEWTVDINRIQQMSLDSIVLHPRPRKNELHPSVDSDPRMRDVKQMENMGPARMSAIARLFGVRLTRKALLEEQSA